MIELLKQALADAKRNERHNNVAETRYWLNQYKLIAEQAIAELESQGKTMKVKGPLHVVCQCDKCKTESQEPVAWARYPRYTGKTQLPEIVFKKPDGKDWLELYAHPPQRTWVGLTVEEIAACCMESTTTQLSFYNAIEAKLKELNT